MCKNPECNTGKDGRPKTIRSPKSRNWKKFQLCFKCFLQKFPAYRTDYSKAIHARWLK
jgi:hypothetical protein